MSLLKEFRDTENALSQQLKRMEKLKKNEALIKDLEFEKKLEALLKRYSKKMEDLLAFLQPPPPLAGTQVREQGAPYGTNSKKTISNAKKARR
jgi:hypothetical protein